VTVRIDVTERLAEAGGSTLYYDVPEVYTGVGDSGGRMVLNGNHFQYNLATDGMESGTIKDLKKFFRILATVSFNDHPATIVGMEDATLESK
jgi:hypothetical protein